MIPIRLQDNLEDFHLTDSMFHTDPLLRNGAILCLLIKAQFAGRWTITHTASIQDKEE